MYVIQERFREWDKWETQHYKGRFKTLPEAKAALSTMPFPSQCRVAQEYTVTRYKAVKGN